MLQRNEPEIMCFHVCLRVILRTVPDARNCLLLLFLAFSALLLQIPPIVTLNHYVHLDIDTDLTSPHLFSNFTTYPIHPSIHPSSQAHTLTS